jgi:sirohydrochlorin ferrochelatase
MTPLILVAHGSRHPAAAPAIWAMGRQVAAALGGDRVRTAFLTVEVPTLKAALAKESALSYAEATVVPLLLAAGRHARITVPGEISAAVRGGLPLSVRLARTLGPGVGTEPDRPALDLIVRALRRRLAEALTGALTGASTGAPGRPLATTNADAQAIVLAAAGSRSSRAMQSAMQVANALGSAAGLPCRAAFTANGTMSVGEAVRAWQQRGAERVVVATYLLAPGVLADLVARDAARAGAIAVAAPLGDAAELVELVLARARAATVVQLD